jgi:hypothetical protein
MSMLIKISRSTPMDIQEFLISEGFKKINDQHYFIKIKKINGSINIFISKKHFRCRFVDQYNNTIIKCDIFYPNASFHKRYYYLLEYVEDNLFNIL